MCDFYKSHTIYFSNKTRIPKKIDIIFRNIKMEKSTHFKLVKGTFSPSESKEILFKLINSKIKFHQLEAFSLKERNSGITAYHVERIEELEHEKEKLTTYLLEATALHKNLKLEGTITITTVE